jgi:hypothetical protein
MLEISLPAVTAAATVVTVTTTTFPLFATTAAAATTVAAAAATTVAAAAATTTVAAAAATTTVAAAASAAATTVAAAASAAAATVAATATAAATTCWALFFRTGFIDCEVATSEILAIQTLNCSRHGLRSIHANESKATWASAFTVNWEKDVCDNAELGEKLADIDIASFEGEIPHVHLGIHI